MLLYIIKRDVLMYAIPYLTCNVNSLLLLPKSNAETQLNTATKETIFFSNEPGMSYTGLCINILHVIIIILRKIAYHWWNIAYVRNTIPYAWNRC